MLDALAAFSFYGLLAGLLITAALTVTTRNLFHAAIYLAFTLIGIAVVYFYLRADFIAGVQILIYVGAIMTLVIFAIMLTVKISDPNISQTNRQKWPAFIALFFMAVMLLNALLRTPWKLALEPRATDAVAIGKALMGTYVFPFEVISVVLLTALIGTIVIARND